MAKYPEWINSNTFSTNMPMNCSTFVSYKHTPNITHKIYFISIFDKTKRYIYKMDNLTENNCPVIRTT